MVTHPRMSGDIPTLDGWIFTILFTCAHCWTFLGLLFGRRIPQHRAIIDSAEIGYPVNLLASVSVIPASRYFRISSSDFLMVLMLAIKSPRSLILSKSNLYKLTGDLETFRSITFLSFSAVGLSLQRGRHETEQTGNRGKIEGFV